jgi:hypothetical protein
MGWCARRFVTAGATVTLSIWVIMKSSGTDY